jgi:hypothetical protein
MCRLADRENRAPMCTHDPQIMAIARDPEQGMHGERPPERPLLRVRNEKGVMHAITVMAVSQTAHNRP